jgi:hypothetical protein
MSESQIKDKTATKLFLGCSLTSELKMHLNSSPEWLDTKIDSTHSDALKEVPFENQKFVGLYLEEEKLTLDALKEHEAKLRLKIGSYCCRLDCSNLKCFIFSQFFIS